MLQESGFADDLTVSESVRLIGRLTGLGSAIFEWIEAFYNPRRRHSALGYRAPHEFEALHTAPPAAA